MNSNNSFNYITYATDTKMYIIDKAFKIAKSKGLSQDKISKAIGVSQSTVSRYSRNIGTIPADKWIALICYINPNIIFNFDSMLLAMEMTKK